MEKFLSHPLLPLKAPSRCLIRTRSNDDDDTEKYVIRAKARTMESMPMAAEQYVWGVLREESAGKKDNKAFSFQYVHRRER